MPSSDVIVILAGAGSEHFTTLEQQQHTMIVGFMTRGQAQRIHQDDDDDDDDDGDGDGDGDDDDDDGDG